MAAIRGRNTETEMSLRRLLHRMGFRYRLHRRDLPGTPDLVFAGRRAVVFVHGCFWHRHQGCANAVMPATRQQFWAAKLEANVARDARVLDRLCEAGWRALVVWECDLRRDPHGTAARLAVQLRLARPAACAQLP